MRMPNTNMGVITTTVIENTCPHKTPTGVTNDAAKTGRVLALDCVSMNAYRNSFHEYKKQNIAVVANPGPASGKVIRKNAPI